MRNKGQWQMLSLAAASVMCITALALAAEGTDSPARLELAPDWNGKWRERRLDSTPTRFIEVEENGAKVLMATSAASASALWVPTDVVLAEGTKLSWRWKVTRGLSNVRERQKIGDDYAARVFVSFNEDPFDKSSRSLCYVWASKEAVGSVYASPYSSNVATIVLKSGEDATGEWASEKRDIVEDYSRAFGTSPRSLHAVAVMVDTDNTRSRATAWFSDLVLESARRPLTPSKDRFPPSGY